MGRSLKGHPSTKKKQLTLRLPEPLLAKLDALASRFELSREKAAELIVAAADEQALIRGFAAIGGLLRSEPKD
jgi:hypothetical protein